MCYWMYELYDKKYVLIGTFDSLKDCWQYAETNNKEYIKNKYPVSYQLNDKKIKLEKLPARKLHEKYKIDEKTDSKQINEIYRLNIEETKETKDKIIPSIDKYSTHQTNETRVLRFDKVKQSRMSEPSIEQCMFYACPEDIGMYDLAYIQTKNRTDIVVSSLPYYVLECWYEIHYNPRPAKREYSSDEESYVSWDHSSGG